MKFYDESKFNMWRACFAALWADGKLSPEEKEWALKKINSLRFTDEQRRILLSELQSQADFEAIVENISDQRDRAFLAHQIRVISHLDDHFSLEEKRLLEQWRKVALGGVDFAKVEEQLAQSEREEQRRAKVEAGKAGIFEKIVRSAQRYFT